MFSFSASLFSQTEITSQRIDARFLQRDDAIGNSLGQGLKNGVGVELDEKAVKPTAKGFDVDKVIDTVMQFVEKRIVDAKSQGATGRELESMFDAARSGVKAGFAEAREQIEALNKMNQPLEKSIDKSEAGINKGIDKLEKRILPPANEPVPDPVKTNSAGRNEATPQNTSTQKTSYVQAYQQKNESFDFQLTTQDGDTVSISAFYEQSRYGEVLNSQGGGSSLAYAGYEKNESYGFDLLVQGTLDDDEKRAISDLLVQVEALAKEFYQGDLQVAFEMALELNSDPSEIARFSLNLSQQQTTAVEIGRYRSQAPAYERAELPRGLAEPLANFAAGVRDAYDLASRFEQPQRLLDDLFEQFDPTKMSSRLLAPLLEQLRS